MKRISIRFLILTFILFLAGSFFYISFGQSAPEASVAPATKTSQKIFGGKITKTKAIAVQNVEDEGYTCSVPGISIEIKPISGKFPTDYDIPNAYSKKRNIHTGQWIIGKYTPGAATITCISEKPPYDTRTLELNEVSIYGVSK